MNNQNESREVKVLRLYIDENATLGLENKQLKVERLDLLAEIARLESLMPDSAGES